jgi:hypothetical protein
MRQVGPGLKVGKELHSSSQGLSTAKIFAVVPTDGSAIYARLWWKTGAGWERWRRGASVRGVLPDI